MGTSATTVPVGGWPATAAVRQRWGQVRRLCGPPQLIVALIGLAIVTGLVEACVLAAFAGIASSMVLGTRHLTVDLSGARIQMSVGSALAVVLALAVVRLLLGIAVARLPARMVADAQARWRREILDAFTSASWAVQAADREGHLQELMTSQVNQALGAMMQLVASIGGGAMFLALAGAAFVLSPLVAAMLLVTAVVLFWGFRPLSRLGRGAARDLSQIGMDYAAELSEVVRVAEDAHVFDALTANRLRVGTHIDAGRRAFFRYLWTGGLARNLYQSLVMVLIVLGLIGLYLTGAGNLASLGAVVLMLVRSTSYAQQLQGGVQALNQLEPYLQRIAQATARYRASAPASGSRPIARVESLVLEDVTFAYRPGRPALDRVSLAVAAGEAVGLVGPSGAGKSTLIQILLRLRDPDAGRYLVNGLPAASLDLHQWRRKVAYVAQDSRIIHATVADNIRFFRDLDRVAIERAARLAHIHDEIMRLPSGYDTVISQVADAVSGGQRQRICIARALAAQPDVLVLDEPTSALDAASEAAVRASLEALHGHTTVIVAAHRLSLLSHCDRVLVLAEGAIAGVSSAAQLEHRGALGAAAANL